MLTELIVLRGGRVLDPSQGLDQATDVVIEAGRIKALGRDALRARSTLPFSIAGTFGASAAAGILAGLTSLDQYRYLFSYAAQQASGVMTYARDTEHIEKAFIFGGMPARNGVTGATMIQAGFTGVWDVFSGDNNFFLAFTDSTRPANPDLLVEDLGVRYEVMLTNMKKYCVGFPIQSAMEALLLTVEEHGYKAEDVEAIEARILKSGAHTVNDREMPDINLQYCFAVALIDGAVSFAAAHDEERLRTDPAIAALKSRVTLIGDDSFGEGKYQASVAVTLKDGRTVSKHVESFRAPRLPSRARLRTRSGRNDRSGGVARGWRAPGTRASLP